jgi:hypothetical protein
MGEPVPEDLQRFAEELDEEVERVNAAPGS